MNRELTEVRKPLFKVVRHENIDRASQLYSKYLREELTPQAIKDSAENPFVAAFIYNELYDIKEYLLHLRSMEITTQSYNIMKHYLRHQDRPFIMGFFDQDHSTDILRVLKGEIYRICQYAVDDFDEYFFLGYVSIGDVLLPCFEEMFSVFAPKNPRVIGMLDISSQRVRKAVLTGAAHYIDYLCESGLLGSLLDELDFNALSADQIVAIFSSKGFERSRIPAFLAKIRRASKFFDIVLRGGPEVYFSSKDVAISKIARLTCPRDYVTNYFFLMLYYEPSTFDSKAAMLYFKGHEYSEPFRILLKVPGVDICREDLYDRIRGTCSKSSVLVAAELFARFLYTLEFQAPDLADILDLPEKFFSHALKFVDTPCARSLRVFNDNLLNERLKRHVSSDIDRDVFIEYLIKRRKLFDIDLDGYEHMMDDEYKLMYAQYNLGWASKNIEMLDQVGIPDRLYRSLSNSSFKDCLSKVVKRPGSFEKTKALESLETNVSKKVKLP